MSTASMWRRIGRWSGASRRSLSASRVWTRPSGSSARSRTVTKRIIPPSSPRKPWWRLPDKAIDVMDEAGSRARLKSLVLPEDIREMENEVERLRQQKEDAIRTQAFEVAARLRDAERRLRGELEERRNKWKEFKTKEKIIVNDEDIAYIVSKWTGIPLYQIEEAEAQRLLRMEEDLGKRVVGQEEAIRAVTRAIRRS